ncbi:MAG TPA: sugar kinase [Lachnospiraceae bacterium]|nr:sugar kinase [Lachnospiraceae bacterium]
MKIELKKEYRYGIACPTSMGVRITPADRQCVQNSHTFYMQATSAESNVVNIASSLGYKGLVLTKFVKDNAIASFIQNELRSRNIEYEGASVDAGGPWGYRHQFNIADSGYGLRGPVVTNDRAGEVGRTLDIREFDIDRIFGKEGVAILHISGLIAALSEETSKFCLELAKAAKSYGTVISFDLNFRASFWKGRETELRGIFTQIAGMADILIGNEEDFQLALGLKGPEAGGKDIENKIEGFKGMIETARKEFPGTQIFATTLRTVINANEHKWGAILEADGQYYVENQRDIPVLDRIGGGDGFTGGLLYGVLKGWEPEKCMQFGWACGALVPTCLNDYGSPSSEDQVWNIYAGNARVKR